MPANGRWDIIRRLKVNLAVWVSDLLWLVPTNQDENTRREKLHHAPRSIKLSLIKWARLLSRFKEWDPPPIM